jgi:hypothetical protein
MFIEPEGFKLVSFPFSFCVPIQLLGNAFLLWLDFLRAMMFVSALSWAFRFILAAIRFVVPMVYVYRPLRLPFSNSYYTCVVRPISAPFSFA